MFIFFLLHDYVDLNECEMETDECQQLCRNNNGSYSCDCNDGFYLDTNDNRSCLSKFIVNYNITLCLDN